MAIQSSSAAFTPLKDMILYFWKRAKYVKELEDNLTKLTAEMGTFYSTKQQLDRVLERDASKEKNDNYHILLKQFEVFQKEYIKFIHKYHKHCQNLPSVPAVQEGPTAVHDPDVSTTSNVTRKPTILTHNFFTLEALGRDIKVMLEKANHLDEKANHLDHTLRITDMVKVDKVMLEKKVEPIQVKHVDVDLPSFTGYVQKVLSYLSEDENRSIGILGPIGVGKTTVIKMLNNQLKDNSSAFSNGIKSLKFEVVIRINYSKHLDAEDKTIETMQDVIMGQLKLNKEKDNNIEQNADVISTALMHEKYILLIDQVSSAFDFDKVGILKDHKFGKVVVASSSKKIIRQMTDDQVEILPLSQKDSLDLFQEVCGMIYDKRIKLIAESIVASCGGLPRAIKLVAMHLKGEKDEQAWSDVKRILLSEAKSATLLKLGELGNCYKLVYDALEKSYKKCLLFVALFPSGHRINKDYLVECWNAERFLELDIPELRSARERGATVMKELTDQYLLENSDMHVTMPVHVRRMALELDFPGEENNVNLALQMDKFPDEVTWRTSRRMSLICSKSKLPECPESYNMSTLLLQRNSDLVTLGDLFFRKMYNLSTLDLNQTGIKSLPSSISYLFSLRCLYLNNCSLLVELPSEVHELRKLEVFDIRGTSIQRLPDEIGELSQLRCLRISFAQKGCARNSKSRKVEMKIPPNIISRLQQLEELVIEAGCCCQGWNAIVDQLTDELTCLEKLNTLSFHFPSASGLKRFVTESKSLANIKTYWKTNTFRSFKISVGCCETQHPYGADVSGISGERFLRFSNSEEISSVDEVLRQASSFELVGHCNVESLGEFNLENTEGLKVCILEKCKNLSSVVDTSKIDTSGKTDCNVLQCLEKLHLFDLQLLQCVWKGSIFPRSLTNLKVLTLFDCPELTEIFSHELAKALSSLEHVKVEKCSKLVEIVDSQVPDVQDISEHVDLSDILHRVKTIELVNLPELQSICESTSMNWKSLRKIEIISCNELRNLGSTLREGGKLQMIKCEVTWWDALVLPKEEKDKFSPRCEFIVLEQPLVVGALHEAESSQPSDTILKEITEVEEASDSHEQQETELHRRHENMPIFGSGKAALDPEVEAEESKHDGYCGSELGMGIPISVTGKMSIHAELRFEILSSSFSQEMLNLSKSFGLDPEKDKYFFSATKKVTKPELDTENGVLLPHHLVVDRSGWRSEDMPTDDEWRQAGVMNLSGRNFLSLNEEKVDCPNLVLLFLQRNNSLSHIPSSFFDRMPALRFLDLSATRISVSGLPTSLFKLKDLQVLLLRSGVCLDSLPDGVKNLQNMELLDLSSSDLYSLPKEIGQLTRLKHLQLSFYGPDYGSGYARLPQELVPPSIFSELKDLEALSIVVHPEDQRWIKIAQDIINYVKRLKKLSHLQFYFPTVEALVSFVDVSPSWKKQMMRFKFVVGHNVKRIISRVPDEVELKYGQFDQCLRFINGGDVPEKMKRVLKSVKAFYLDHHLEIQNLSEFGISNFRELEFCVVRECPSFQVMTTGDKSSSESDVAPAFPNLEHLGMHYLWEMERIWEDPVPSGSFKALKCLMVDTCPKLEYVASQSMLQCLSNLETFIIEDCESLRSIVKESKTAKSDATSLLPRLTELVLRHLPKLATLGSGLYPSDEIITVHFCPKLIPRRTKRTKLLHFISRLACDKLYKIKIEEIELAESKACLCV